MGEQNVQRKTSRDDLRQFMQHLLRDVRAFETMLEGGHMAMDTRRIGAEQEMFLVDKQRRAALKSMELLEVLDNDHFTTELGRFNLELNLAPLLFQGNCLSQLEQNLTEQLNYAREMSQSINTDITLTGILPTLQKSDLSLDSMAPMPRYRALNDALGELRGGPYTLNLRGLDELHLKHNNVMLEATCTSFQLHFQVDPSEFAHAYNTAQLISAPLLAVAGNAPLLFGRRLWQETRIPVFQQAVDTREASYHIQDRHPRVSFGTRWVEQSIVEIFKEDISRFRVLLGKEIDENPLEVLREGKIPKLMALCTHNGTVYRWNRACYGQNGERAHIRIENRILPSGPSVIDEVANAALFFGLMNSIPKLDTDFTKVITFENAQDNFLVCAQRGLEAHVHWINGKRIPVKNLLLDKLLPLAREGLQAAQVDQADIDQYIGIIEERIKTERTGSRWMLEAIEKLRFQGNRHEILHALVDETIRQQWEGKPVHTWPLPALKKGVTLKQTGLRVNEGMSTDLYAVNAHEPIELAIHLMEWHNLTYVPVTDDRGAFEGLISFRDVLSYLQRMDDDKQGKMSLVSSIMDRNPATTTPYADLELAIEQMHKAHTSCLPVLEEGKLIGIITEHDFVRISQRLLAEHG